MSHKKKMQYKVAATATIHHAADMTQAGKKSIAAWLRKQARNLLKDGGRYSARFTARYYYRTSRAWVVWLPFCYYVGKTLICAA